MLAALAFHVHTFLTPDCFYDVVFGFDGHYCCAGTSYQSVYSSERKYPFAIQYCTHYSRYLLFPITQNCGYGLSGKRYYLTKSNTEVKAPDAAAYWPRARRFSTGPSPATTTKLKSESTGGNAFSISSRSVSLCRAVFCIL